MLEFVDSGLYFVDPDPVKKVPDPAGQKSTDPTGSGSSSLQVTPLKFLHRQLFIKIRKNQTRKGLKREICLDYNMIFDNGIIKITI